MRLKRAFDLAGATLLLVLLAPLMALVALLVLLSLGRPVLFRQQRPGLGGRPFQLLKFRTMSDARDASGALLPNEARVTRLGHWLRATSLDELPELWNVCRGEMSLVGPRPLLMEYLPLYDEFQRRRHEVPPGITGWAQVNGRNLADWPERFRMDVWYVDHRSLWLDLRILGLTLLRVLRRDGISPPGKVSVDRFRGAP